MVTFAPKIVKKTMNRWCGKISIVTGANSGIGAAIATNLVHNGLKVVGLARRNENLIALRSKIARPTGTGEFIPLVADIRKEDDIITALDWVQHNLGPPAILINNAGVTRYSSLMGGNSDDWRTVLETNVLGMAMMTRETIKLMQKYDVPEGHIINVSSVSAYVTPTLKSSNMYGPSKHAVRAMVDNLRNELLRSGVGERIKVSCITPGLVKTGIFKAAGIDASKWGFLEQKDHNYPILDPTDIAEAVEFMLSRPNKVLIYDMIIKATKEKF